MISSYGYNFKSIAMVCTMAILFFSCQDNYKRSGEEKVPLVYPMGIAENFTATYTEAREMLESEDSTSTRVIAVLTSPLNEDYNNLKFPHRIFPKGLLVNYYNEEGQKSIIKADYGIIYSATNVIDLQGNVVIESHDGKKLETPQLYWDQDDNWIFTQEKFKFTNPEDGTIMDGEGMDFNRDLSFFIAHKTYGLMTIKEESDD
ncbi:MULTISPECIES: LPS export ABC transporter periplasmic protein LptC [Zobellia]|uniref:LPS export ABC transporter periplasmic protein LptC n=1 Tax=Zobellia TaxID=112040 RepID=UPI000B52AA13|nr:MULTISPECIES: LPS export ABC transporter periplasmic protein LptC [Zobellia]MBU3028268.1 LPS export ABC transporter periplasmic protein LptC [Zobellia galactanivorans]OWW26314.1 LPS export ABC transporter periplasmic protein LptC [Zobellia sp. OII3]